MTTPLAALIHQDDPRRIALDAALAHLGPPMLLTGPRDGTRLVSTAATVLGWLTAEPDADPVADDQTEPDGPVFIVQTLDSDMNPIGDPVRIAGTFTIDSQPNAFGGEITFEDVRAMADDDAPVFPDPTPPIVAYLDGPELVTPQDVADRLATMGPHVGTVRARLTDGRRFRVEGRGGDRLTGFGRSWRWWVDERPWGDETTNGDPVATATADPVDGEPVEWAELTDADVWAWEIHPTTDEGHPFTITNKGVLFADGVLSPVHSRHLAERLLTIVVDQLNEVVRLRADVERLGAGYDEAADQTAQRLATLAENYQIERDEAREAHDVLADQITAVTRERDEARRSAAIARDRTNYDHDRAETLVSIGLDPVREVGDPVAGHDPLPAAPAGVPDEMFAAMDASADYDPPRATTSDDVARIAAGMATGVAAFDEALQVIQENPELQAELARAADAIAEHQHRTNDAAARGVTPRRITDNPQA